MLVYNLNRITGNALLACRTRQGCTYNILSNYLPVIIHSFHTFFISLPLFNSAVVNKLVNAGSC